MEELHGAIEECMDVWQDYQGPADSGVSGAWGCGWLEGCSRGAFWGGSRCAWGLRTTAMRA